MDKNDCARIERYLRRLFRNTDIRVTGRPRKTDSAEFYIGEDCLGGANALVTEGKVFEPGWLIVGAPARAVRKLDAAAIAQLRLPAAGYVANWRRFAAGLKEIAG